MPGKVALELEDVADVGSTERVDRVVGDEPVRDEVVEPLDVEVVDRRVERAALDGGDAIEPPLAGDHHHADAGRSRPGMKGSDGSPRARSGQATRAAR